MSDPTSDLTFRPESAPLPRRHDQSNSGVGRSGPTDVIRHSSRWTSGCQAEPLATLEGCRCTRR